MRGFLPLRVPGLRAEVAEDDEVAPVVGHDLPVAAPQRAVRPPAVLHEPGLPDRLDSLPAHPLRPPLLPGVDLHLARRGEPARAARLWHRGGAQRGSFSWRHGSHGASVCLLSGTLESGSTGTIRSAASGPATARVCRTASRSRAARMVAGSEISERWRPAGGPSPSTRRRSTSAGAGSFPGRGGGARPPPPRA